MALQPIGLVKVDPNEVRHFELQVSRGGITNRRKVRVPLMVRVGDFDNLMAALNLMIEQEPAAVVNICDAHPPELLAESGVVVKEWG